jgi:hypothetical protein
VRRCADKLGGGISHHDLEPGLVLRDLSIRLKHGVEAPLLVPIMNQDDGREPNRLLARPADPRFTFEILNEPIGKVICRPRPPSGLGTVRPAVRASEFDLVLERITIQCRPPCVPNAYCL